MDPELLIFSALEYSGSAESQAWSPLDLRSRQRRKAAKKIISPRSTKTKSRISKIKKLTYQVVISYNSQNPNIYQNIFEGIANDFNINGDLELIKHIKYSIKAHNPDRRPPPKDPIRSKRLLTLTILYN